MLNKIISLILIVSVCVSCSFNRFVVGQMTPVLQKSADALYEETDLQLAEQALASNLKLLEGLLKNDPGNEELLLLLSQGYAGYALGFVEDNDPPRAVRFYDRAFVYGVKALLEGDDSPWKWSEANKKRLEKVIEKADKGQTAGLFWTAFALAGKLNLSLNDPSALIHLPVIEALADKIEQMQPSFFNGGVYLLKGSIAGMKPRMLGGNPEKALEYFNKNLSITKGRFLLTYIYMSKFYAAKILDEELFDEYLKNVEQFNVDDAAEFALFNQIAKKKAQLLKNQKESLF
jgi:hypothetical protein